MFNSRESKEGYNGKWRKQSWNSHR